jgi:hypothetical protein
MVLALFNSYFRPTDLLVLGVLAGIPVAIAAVKGFAPVERWVDEWARARGLRVTPETRPFLVHHLGLGRRMRTLGFILGWVARYVPPVVGRDVRLLGEEPAVVKYAWVLGYLLGAVVAELWFSRTGTTAPAASLTPRTLPAYLPRWARVTPRLTVLGAACLVPLYHVVPWATTGFGPSVRGYAGMALLAAAAVFGIEALQRLIVRRRQPFTSEAMVETDDALRSASVNILAGVAILVSASVFANLLHYLGTRTDVQVLRWLSWPAAMVLSLGGFVAFLQLSNPMLHWRVRRGLTGGQQA